MFAPFQTRLSESVRGYSTNMNRAHLRCSALIQLTCLSLNNIHRLIVEDGEGNFNSIYNFRVGGQEKIWMINRDRLTTETKELITVFNNNNSSYSLTSGCLYLEDWIEDINSENEFRFIAIFEVFINGSFECIALKSSWYSNPVK